jgi:hypothetical protein
MKNWIRIATAIGVLAVPTLVAAQNNPGEGDEHHHGPGPEAIAACKNKSEGNACEYDGRHGHESGACRKVRSGDLACVHPHQHHEDGNDAGVR